MSDYLHPWPNAARMRNARDSLASLVEKAGPGIMATEEGRDGIVEICAIAFGMGPASTVSVQLAAGETERRRLQALISEAITEPMHISQVAPIVARIAPGWEFTFGTDGMAVTLTRYDPESPL